MTRNTILLFITLLIFGACSNSLNSDIPDESFDTSNNNLIVKTDNDEKRLPIIIDTLISEKFTSKILYHSDMDSILRETIKLTMVSQIPNKPDIDNKDKFFKRNDLIKSNGSTLSIKLSNSEKLQFISKPDEETEKIIYKYVGHNDSLKAFMLFVEYWERSEYILYSTLDGNEIVRFNDCPYFSENFEFIASINACPYTSSSALELYRIKNNKIETIIKAEFYSWMCADFKPKIDWIDNQRFIIRIVLSEDFSSGNGDFNDSRILMINVL